MTGQTSASGVVVYALRVRTEHKGLVDVEKIPSETCQKTYASHAQPSGARQRST